MLTFDDPLWGAGLLRFPDARPLSVDLPGDARAKLAGFIPYDDVEVRPRNVT